MTVQLTFLVMYLGWESPYSSYCVEDFVEVRQNNAQGLVLAKLCGSTLPAPIESNNSLYIHFHSDSSFSYQGFQATYKLIGITSDSVRLVGGQTSNQGTLQHYVSKTWIPVCGNGFVSNAASVVCRELGFSSRNVTLSVSTASGTLADSRWYQCTGSEDNLAQCPTLQNACSLNSVQITCIASPCARLPCSALSTCLELGNSYECVCPSGYSGLNCDKCGDNLTASQGTFTSPNYPSSYSNNMDCIWTIVTILTMPVELTFLVVNTESGSDYVDVRQNNALGTLLARVSGSTLPGPIVSSTSLYIHFRSDSSVVFSGFRASYRIRGCPDYTFGYNCSETCGCVQENTLSCDEFSGRCVCKTGWEDAACATKATDCEYKCKSREVCRIIPYGGYGCVCTEGSARDVNENCVETIDVPIKITIDADVDFDERNKTSVDSLSSRIHYKLSFYLVWKQKGVLDFEVINIRKGSIIVDAFVLVAKINATKAISVLIKNLKDLMGNSLQFDQTLGQNQVEVAGEYVSYNTQPCVPINVLKICKSPTDQCDDSTGEAVCRSYFESNSKIEVWKIIVIFICVGAGAITGIFALCFCIHRKKQSSENSRPVGPSMISNGREQRPVGRTQQSYAYDNPAMLPKPYQANLHGYFGVQPSASPENAYTSLPPSAPTEHVVGLQNGVRQNSQEQAANAAVPSLYPGFSGVSSPLYNNVGLHS